MSDRALQLCIRAFLKLAKIHSSRIRRHCNAAWCSGLRDLSGDRLITRLKYILWWTPLRVIVVAHNRGVFRGHRVLTCVFEELKRRGVEDAPSVRAIRDEIQRKYYLA